ncbi:hypothetical protein RJ639_028964 [Escallonia herrerae]|uniref:P-type ATPase A domain-containing protein n=1 Tax=Escallonia herrerae TaxID=1293975 RepID=A0AA88X5Y6_9ASTE|nr:hypothetical protein RJ639_028964 [Escallonia herrerae]
MIISAISNFWPDKQCRKLSKASSIITEVDVVRHGQSQRLPISNVVVGDVVFLMHGDQVPAGGLFLREISIQVENLLNGKAERLKVDSLNNLFLFSSTSVVHRHAQMLVTAVGRNRKSRIIHLDGRLIDQCENLTSFVVILLGLVGSRSSLRPGINKALNDCIGAGVTLKLITGDNMFTDSNIDTECRILEARKNQHNILVEGQEFRNSTTGET